MAADPAQHQDGIIFCEGTKPNGEACKNSLGVDLDGNVQVVRYKGRVITGLIFGITCCKCGWTWRPRSIRSQLGEQRAA